MSSVVIAGDTSGTVTLQAPAVAGTTTLTLPATSGTVITGAGGVTGVASGGTGANTLTTNNVILGNGTSAVQFVAPGSNGNVLTSNGTTWTSAAASGGQIQTQIFTAPGTWTKPASCSQVRVTVIGGGAGAASTSPPNVSAGGTSSFGSIASATGGPAAANLNGAGTVSVGTELKSGAYAVGNITLGQSMSVGVIAGSASAPAQPAVAYTTSGSRMAGSGGGPNGSPGGLAIAIAPVSSPQPVTIGAGSNGGNAARLGGVGGAVVVEFVG